MQLLDAPLASAEFLAVDVETNGCAGERSALTEVGAVLVGGGELHERFESLVATDHPPSRAVERLTGISAAMLAPAPAAVDVLRELATRLEGRVLVAHNAAFDRRALRTAFGQAGLAWPDPPALCTVALARQFAPLAPQRRLAALAAALDVEVDRTHRALADAETCARVFCALFRRLCAHAATVGDAVALLAGRRRSARRTPPGRLAPGSSPDTDIEFSALPDEPGVYIFRDAAGRPLYVGKSVSLRARARSHFAPGAPAVGWRAHAAFVDHRVTASELGALVLENRLVKAERPPGNVRLRRRDGYVYIRCRLDIPFPVLEVATQPAAGCAVNVGPLRGRALAAELVDQLESLFGLRRCGRRLPRRDHPSAYGQMGRCLSPCLQDLDPNLYRRRLDGALSLFTAREDGRDRLLAHVEGEVREAAAALRFERAQALLRRAGRLEQLMRRVGGELRTLTPEPRLLLAAHPTERRFDAFWIVGGRIVDWGPLPGEPELERRTALALRAQARAGGADAVPVDSVDEVRLVSTYLAARPETPVLPLTHATDAAAALAAVSCGPG